MTADRTVREAAYLDEGKLLARSPRMPHRDPAGADIVIRGVDRATRNTSSAIAGEFEALAAGRSSLHLCGRDAVRDHRWLFELDGRDPPGAGNHRLAGLVGLREESPTHQQLRRRQP